MITVQLGVFSLFQELKKHMPLDIYGDCFGGQKCSRDGEQCCKDMETNYKFYLSFENSVCNEYITEKFWQILGKEIYKKIFCPPIFLVA